MAVIAGNWKMHHGPEDTRRFFSELALPDAVTEHELIVFPPAVSVTAAVEAEGRDARVHIGVQNIHWEDEGAFTGELSAPMAAQAGAAFVLVGHSERRHVFGESDDQVAWKVEAALRSELTPVICVGEKLDERREGRVEEVVLRQLDAALVPLDDTSGPARILVAYEPVWAIGTGETATPEDASAAHGAIRAHLDEALGASRSARVPILYGGSVKPHNAAELLAAPEVGGVLVGGASLTAQSFAAIAGAA